MIIVKLMRKFILLSMTAVLLSSIALFAFCSLNDNHASEIVSQLAKVELLTSLLLDDAVAIGVEQLAKVVDLLAQFCAFVGIGHQHPVG